MKQEEAYQIQRGDYFLYHGETVKVTGRSHYNENDYNVVNKNGSKFYAEVEELEPIVLNEYTLEQGGIHKEERFENTFNYKDILMGWNSDGFIWYISRFFEDIEMDIKYLHVLQNALRLLGEEAILKQ